MARELKVFGYTINTRSDESAKLGQRPHIRQARAIVAAKTIKEAAEKFGITSSEARNFMGQTGNIREIEIAMEKPGQVFALPLDNANSFIEIERKPHVVRPRKVHAPVAPLPQKSDLVFTKEELEHMIYLFSDSNHPLSQSIAEKAHSLSENVL